MGRKGGKNERKAEPKVIRRRLAARCPSTRGGRKIILSTFPKKEPLLQMQAPMTSRING